MSSSAFDWSACMICQTQTGQPLICPINGRKHNPSDVYVQFAERFDAMAKISEPPKDHFKLQNLFQSCLSLANIAAEMSANKGLWHKECYLRYNMQAKDRLEKRTYSNATSTDDMLVTKDMQATIPQQGQGPAELVDTMNDGRRKSLRASGDFKNDRCIFCQLHSTETLLNIMTVEAGVRFYSMALALQIQPLLTYLEYANKGEKGVEQEMKYHILCRTTFLNKFKTHNRSTIIDNSNEAARAFCNLIQYIAAQVEEGLHFFTLPILADLHQGFRDALGITTTFNKSMLKDKLATYFEGEASWIQRDNMKTFSLCFHSALQKGVITTDEKFKVISQCATIVRKAILSHQNKYDFATQQFTKGAQEGSVPDDLKALISLIMYRGAGPEVNVDTQPMLTIAQLLMVNTKKTTPSTTPSFTRKSIAQDTPLPLFVSLFVWQETKCMKIVKKLYDLGIGVHPNRVYDLVDHIAAALCEAFRVAGDVIPPMLVIGQFVSFHADNIDWQTTSTHSKGDLHGTALTGLQGHFDPVLSLRIPTHYPVTMNRDLKLPLHYTTVDFFPPDIKNLKFTSTDRGIDLIPHDPGPMQKALEAQRMWVSDVQLYVNGKPVENTSAVSWPTWQANLSEARNIFTAAEPATKTFFPVRRDQFATVENIAHILKNALRTTDKVNPGQMTLICLDQPPYCIAKSLQIKYPRMFGRDRIFIDFGPLHIEMNLQIALGQLLKDSGWVEQLKKAGIHSADSCLGHTNAMRSRNAMAISVAALALLQFDAFMDSLEEGTLFSREEFVSWVATQLKYPNFQYWDLILRTQNLVLIFVSAVRNRDVVLYIDALEQLVPLMFILDHQNYARWLSIYINDLRTQTPQFRVDYAKNFSVYTNPTRFSAMGIDQQGEQCIKTFKGQGGQSHNTQNEHALLRDNIAHGTLKHMLDTGLHLSKDSKINVSDEHLNNEEQESGPKNHHSYGKASQERFITHVIGFKDAILENGNVFSNTSPDLIALHTAEVMPAVVASSYANMEQLGISQYELFKLKRIHLSELNIDDPIKKNKVALFSNIPSAVIPKSEMTICHLKQDANLFSRALTAKSQGREISVDELLKYEHRQYPPSLSTYDGKLRHATKSDILPILKGIEGDLTPIELPEFVDVIILDGPAIVLLLKLTRKKPATFNDYFCTFSINISSKNSNVAMYYL